MCNPGQIYEMRALGQDGLGALVTSGLRARGCVSVCLSVSACFSSSVEAGGLCYMTSEVL